MKIVLTDQEWQRILEILKYLSDESYCIEMANIIEQAISEGRVEEK